MTSTGVVFPVVEPAPRRVSLASRYRASTPMAPSLHAVSPGPLRTAALARVAPSADGSAAVPPEEEGAAYVLRSEPSAAAKAKAQAQGQGQVKSVRRATREAARPFEQPKVEGHGFGPSRIIPAGLELNWGRVLGNNAEELRSGVSRLAPVQPGVYGMFDEYGRVLYIGQSKKLRVRLLSYFRDSPGDGGKARRLIARTVRIQWEPLPSEFAALLRELELIQRLRPRFNVLGQPGQVRRAFVCLGRGPAPYLYTSPTPIRPATDCFGPLWGTGRVAEAVRVLNDWFQLRDCSQRTPMHFADQKRMPFLPPAHLELTPGCIRHELNQCLGPCAAACTASAYERRCQQARAFLSGKDLRILDQLQEKMQSAAANRSFESAAAWRDRWSLVSELHGGLERIREARGRYAFVFPAPPAEGLAPWWHVVSGGQVEATCQAAVDRPTARVAEAVLRDVYSRPPRKADPELLEAFDMVLLVSRWFQQRPDELALVRPPEDSLLHCRYLAADAVTPVPPKAVRPRRAKAVR